MPFGAVRAPPVEYPPDVLGVNKPARVELAGFLIAIGAEGLRVAVGGIVDCVPVNVLGGNREGFVDVKEGKRFGSLSVLDIGVRAFGKVEVCRGPRIFGLLRLILGLR